MEQDKGASDKSDRAVVNGAGQAVSAVPASVPSARRWLPATEGPIWRYARQMGKALMHILPSDFRVGYRDGLFIEGTVTTMQEAEALREVIRHLGQTLPSSREMIASDIGVEPPKSCWQADLYRLLGVPAQGMAARSGETGTGSTEGNSPVACDAPHTTPESSQ